MSSNNPLATSSNNPSGYSSPSTDMQESIHNLKHENMELKKQVDLLVQRISLLEVRYNQATMTPSTISPDASVASSSPNSPPTTRPPIPSFPSAGTPGRKTIPYDQRTAKQHQNRMDYLLRKIKNTDKETWAYDAIADVQTYCVERNIAGAGQDFFKNAVLECAGENGVATITNIDILLGILQAYNA